MSRLRSENGEDRPPPELSVVEKAVFLQEVALLQETATEDLARIAAICQEIFYRAGEVIFCENSRGDALFFVVAGEVSLRKGEREVRRVYAQETFGDLALLDNQPREFTAVAATDCHVLRLGSEEFFDLLEDHIEMTRGVLRTLAGQIRRQVRRDSSAQPEG